MSACAIKINSTKPFKSQSNYLSCIVQGSFAFNLTGFFFVISRGSPLLCVVAPFSSRTLDFHSLSIDRVRSGRASLCIYHECLAHLNAPAQPFDLTCDSRRSIYSPPNGEQPKRQREAICVHGKNRQECARQKKRVLLFVAFVFRSSFPFDSVAAQRKKKPAHTDWIIYVYRNLCVCLVSFAFRVVLMLSIYECIHLRHRIQRLRLLVRLLFVIFCMRSRSSSHRSARIECRREKNRLPFPRMFVVASFHSSKRSRLL